MDIITTMTSSTTNQFIADKLNSKSYDHMIYIMDQLDEDTKSLLHILTKPEPKQKRVDNRWRMIEGDVFVGGLREYGYESKKMSVMKKQLGFDEINVTFVYLGKKYTGLDMTRDNIETLEEFIEICKNIVEENTHIRGFVLYELGNNTTAWFRSKQFPISESGYNPCSHKMKRTSYIIY